MMKYTQQRGFALIQIIVLTAIVSFGLFLFMQHQKTQQHTYNRKNVATDLALVVRDVESSIESNVGCPSNPNHNVNSVVITTCAPALSSGVQDNLKESGFDPAQITVSVSLKGNT